VVTAVTVKTAVTVVTVMMLLTVMTMMMIAIMVTVVIMVTMITLNNNGDKGWEHQIQSTCDYTRHFPIGDRCGVGWCIVIENHLGKCLNF
jgi:hypothetical protein